MQKRKKITIFFSSTFLDMQGERDAIVTDVLPTLREQLYRFNIQLVDIDLRWGVLDYEDGTTIKTNKWHYCKKAIDKDVDYFVGILGQRYGSPQKKSDFQDEDFQNQDSQLSMNNCIGKSLTEIEILYATNKFEIVTQDSKIKSLFLLRNDELEVESTSFPNDEEQESLKILRTNIKNYGIQNRVPVFNYSCKWDESLSRTVDLEEFGNLLIENLWHLIFNDHIIPELENNEIDFDLTRIKEGKLIFKNDYVTSLLESLKEKTSKENYLMNESEIFINGKNQLFEGRKDELETLQKYLTSKNSQNPVLVYGASGLGKTSLLAHFEKVFIRDNVHNESICISRYIGINQSLTTSNQLLKSLREELDDYVHVVREFTNEASLFKAQIEKFGVDKKDQQLVIIIDAINQLEDVADHTWIIKKLPENIKILVSSIEILPGFSTKNRIDLSELKLNERKQIIHNYLNDYCKSLNTQQINTLINLPNSGNPLYLLVLLNELRTEHTVTDTSSRLKKLSKVVEVTKFDSEIVQIQRLAKKYTTTASLFEWVLQKCERFFNKKVTQQWFTYFIISRSGASLSELNTLLQNDFDQEYSKNGFRIARYIKPYLMYKEDVLFPYHSQFLEAIQKRYIHQVEEKEIIKYHTNWSKLFLNNWKEKNRHALKELPYHLRKSQQSDELYKLADNEDFLKLQVEVLKEIELPQQTQREAMTRALKEGNVLKTVEFLSKPLHMRAANVRYTPLKALEEYHIEYALSVAESYAPQQTAYWYILIAWKVYLDNEQEKVVYILKKLLEKPYVRFTAETKKWILPNAVDTSGEKIQDQNEWICKALVAIIDKHESLVLRIAKRFREENLVLLFIKHLAKKGYVELSKSLLPNSPKNKLRYFETLLYILENTSNTDKELLSKIEKANKLTNDYVIRVMNSLSFSRYFNNTHQYKNSLETLESIRVFDITTIAKDVQGKIIETYESLTYIYDQIHIHLQTIIGYKNLLHSLNTKEDLQELEWENIQHRLKQLYTNIPKEFIRKANEETYYTDTSIKGEMELRLREYIDEGLALVEILYTLDKVLIAEIIIKEISEYVPPTILNYLKFKSKTVQLPNTISESLLGELIEEAFDFEAAYEISSALILLIRFIKDKERQKAFVNFSQKIHLIVDQNKEYTIQNRWLIFMNKERAYQLVDVEYYSEALSSALWMLRYQWSCEFRSLSWDVDKEIFEYNGHAYALLRDLSIIISNNSQWKVLKKIAYYFDEDFRGKWILCNGAISTKNNRNSVDLVEEMLLFENWSALHLKSNISIQLNRSIPVCGYHSEYRFYKLTKEEIKSKISFVKWLDEITSGEKYALKNIFFKIFENLKSSNGEFFGFYNHMILIFLSSVILSTIIKSMQILIENPTKLRMSMSLVVFLSIIYGVYKILLMKKDEILASDFIKKSSRTFHKIKRFNINISDQFLVDEVAFFEFARIKKPEKNIYAMANFYNRFNFDINHPQLEFIRSLKILLNAFLEKKEITMKEVNIINYVFEKINLFKSEGYGDYRQSLMKDYKEPGYAPAICIVKYGEFDRLLLKFIEKLAYKKMYREAFEIIKKIEEPKMEVKARNLLAYIQGSHGDYLGMKWTLETDIRKYNPSGTVFTSNLRHAKDNFTISILPRMIEELVFEGKVETVRKMLELETDYEYKRVLIEHIDNAEKKYTVYKGVKKNIKDNTSQYSNEWIFEKVPFVEIKYDRSNEGKINILCLEFRNLLRSKKYDKIDLLIQKVQNIEIRNILRISYIYISMAYDENITIFYNELWNKPFKGTYAYKNTALPSLLNELFPWMHTWYLDSNDKNRWLTLLVLGMQFYFPEKTDDEIIKLINENMPHDLIVDEIYYLLTKKNIENLEIEKAFQIFQSISKERIHLFVVPLFKSLKEVDVKTQQLVPFFEYFQSTPKMLYNAIEGLSTFFSQKKDELLMAITVEGNRIHSYSRENKKNDLITNNISIQNNIIEVEIFLDAGENLITHKLVSLAIHYHNRAQKSLQLIDRSNETEGLFLRKIKLNVSILKSIRSYKAAYNEYCKLPQPNDDFFRAFYFSEKAMILLLKYEREEINIEDLKTVIENTCIADENLQLEIKYRRGNLHTDSIRTKIYIIFGRVAYQLGLYDRAGILLLYGVATDPEKQPYLHVVADLLINKKDYHGALSIIRTDLENQSHFSDGVLKEIEIYLLTGDFKKAIEVALYHKNKFYNTSKLLLLLMLAIAEEQLGIKTNPYVKQVGQMINDIHEEEFYAMDLNYQHLEKWIDATYYDGHQIKNLSIEVFNFFTPLKKLEIDRNNALTIFKKSDSLINYEYLKQELIRIKWSVKSFVISD